MVFSLFLKRLTYNNIELQFYYRKELKMTKTQMIIKGLELQGWKEVSSNSRKVKTFEDPKKGPKKLFVGKAGSLRYGRVFTQSIPVSETTKNYLKCLGEGSIRSKEEVVS